MLSEILSGKYSPSELVLYIIIMFIALSLSFAIHEFMHAAVATWLGDDVAKLQGRVTLNPLAHIDPMGTLSLLIVGFGWGKPVPYNPNNLTRFKSKRLMCNMVHLAGVTGNFMLALVCAILSGFIARFFLTSSVDLYDIMSGQMDLSGVNPVVFALYSVLSYTEMFCLGLIGFNLIPLPPLDGFHVLEEFLPYKVKYSDKYRKFMFYAPRVVMVLIFISAVTSSFDILGGLVSILSFPASLVCNIFYFLIVYI